MQPFSQACENNKHFILPVLQRAFQRSHQVLEIGAGTGQHAVFFARQLPWLQWHTSDVSANHAGINQWLTAYPADNLHAPVEFDLRAPQWPNWHIDAVFSANTVHIISWPLVETLFATVAANLAAGNMFVLYGPFNYAGQFTSDSNREFDAFLKARDPLSGIRDIEALLELASAHDMQLQDDIAMPANNRCLVWQKGAAHLGIRPD